MAAEKAYATPEMARKIRDSQTHNTEHFVLRIDATIARRPRYFFFPSQGSRACFTFVSVPSGGGPASSSKLAIR